MIDTSAWKEFKISDLFGTAKLGKYHNPKDLQEDDNGYEYICASNFNNGVNLNMPRVKGKNLSLTDEHIIAWGKQCPYFSYHKDSCVTSQGMYYYPVGTISELSALFLCSCFQSLCNSKGYGYNNCLIGVTMDNEIIKLPATSDGQPDWTYMESYMKSIMEESEKSLENLRKANDTKHLSDVSGWHKCRLGDYFDFETGKDMLPTKEKDGDIPVVCLGSNNNGIGLYIAENPKHKLYDEGCITIAGWAGGLFAFYQEQKFYVKGRVKIAIPKQPLSKLAGLFMCTMIDSESWKYTYAEKASGDKLPNTELYLPITSAGEPDWQYMESYMRDRLEEAEKVVAALN